MAFDLKQWFEKHSEGEVLVSHQGEINPDMITAYLDKIEQIFDQKENLSKLRKTTYHVMVEGLQNLYHHSLIDGGELGSRYCTFIVSLQNDTISLVTGNYVREEKTQMLRDRIEQINSLSKDELKNLYKLILNNDEFSEKGGGGLGMIDISRKTGTRMEYDFFPVQEKIYFYSLKINVI
jgi:hypothetical protein